MVKRPFLKPFWPYLDQYHLCNGKVGQLPLAHLKIVVPVWIVDKVLRNEDIELLLVWVESCRSLLKNWSRHRVKCQFSSYVEHETGNIYCIIFTVWNLIYRTVFIKPQYSDYHYPFKTIRTIYRFPQEPDNRSKKLFRQWLFLKGNGNRKKHIF